METYWCVFGYPDMPWVFTLSYYRRDAIRKAIETFEHRFGEHARDMNKAKRDAAWKSLRGRYGARVSKVSIMEIL